MKWNAHITISTEHVKAQSAQAERTIYFVFPVQTVSKDIEKAEEELKSRIDAYISDDENYVKVEYDGKVVEDLGAQEGEKIVPFEDYEYMSSASSGVLNNSGIFIELSILEDSEE